MIQSLSLSFFLCSRKRETLYVYCARLYISDKGLVAQVAVQNKKKKCPSLEGKRSFHVSSRDWQEKRELYAER